MASQTQGIQQLLIAEKRAAEKVLEARKCNFLIISCFKLHFIYFCTHSKKGKQKRLKQAKEEAQYEIEQYRQEREKQFKEFEKQVNCTLGNQATYLLILFN